MVHQSTPPTPNNGAPEYTGHKNTKMHDGKTLVESITPAVEAECEFYGVQPPSSRQMAVVISALRHHTIIMHASDYDTSELNRPNEITKYWPLQSSIGRYFRDAAREELDK